MKSINMRKYFFLMCEVFTFRLLVLEKRCRFYIEMFYSVWPPGGAEGSGSNLRNRKPVCAKHPG